MRSGGEGRRARRIGAAAVELGGVLSVMILVFLGGMLLGFAVGLDAAEQEQDQEQQRRASVPACPCVAGAPAQGG